MTVTVKIIGVVTTTNHITMDYITAAKNLTPEVTIDLGRKSTNIGGSLEVSNHAAISITQSCDLFK